MSELERLAVSGWFEGGLCVGRQPLNSFKPAWNRTPTAGRARAEPSLGVRLKPAAGALPRLRPSLTEAQ